MRGSAGGLGRATCTGDRTPIPVPGPATSSSCRGGRQRAAGGSSRGGGQATATRRDRFHRAACILAIAALGTGLAGCAGSAPASRVPAPPPFRPQAVRVALGQSGSAVTLMTKQGGGFTLNGEDFAGGEVRAANGSAYELALVDGRWVATYLPPEPVVLELGISGTSVSIRRTETGEHRIGELVLADGITVRADNGQAYRLGLVDGDWVAEHVLPDPVVVPLGTSGDVATLQQSEDLTWRLVDSERQNAFESGDQVTTEAGTTYRLEAADGVWSASFVPLHAEVTLGSSDESVTLTQREDGTWLRDGQIMQSGDGVVTDEGAAYRLVLVDGTWSASFVPQRFDVVLGESGATVVVTQAEDGGYLLGDAVLVGGHEYLHQASGNTYVFSRDSDGHWTASYKRLVQRVRLGRFGAVTLARNEDGTWWHGDRLVAAGDTVTSRAGTAYRLELVGPWWVASFVPGQMEIPLGESGASVVATQVEDGGYRLGDAVLAEGHEYLHEGSGNTYIFSIESDGRWRASYKPHAQWVRLGRFGPTVTIVRNEDGTWWHGDRAIRTGDVLTARTGDAFQLTLADGVWSASFLPEETEIAGTGLVALSTERGRGYRVGESSTLPKSGEGDVEVAGALYHVWREDGGLRGVRFDLEPHGSQASEGNYRVGLKSGLAELGEDDPETPANEDRTTLLVAGSEFPLSELLDAGMATVAARAITETVRVRIGHLRRQAEVLVEVLEDDRRLMRQELHRVWDRVQKAVDRIFGSGEVELRRNTGSGTVVGALQAVEAALSSGTAFAEATAAGSGGLFEKAALDPDEAAEIFSAVEWQATAVLAAAGGLRYGAVRKMVRENGVAANRLDLDTAGADFGAFAYSTVEDTPSTANIPHDGTAEYAGGVAAVTGAGRLYTGDIELLVRFGSETVSGLISNLADAEGNPWQYQLLPVDRIVLPNARLRERADWSRRGDIASGALIYYRSLFGRPATVASTFRGHLLGRGENAGSEAVGVWSVGDEDHGPSYIVGGFGAARVDAWTVSSQGGESSRPGPTPGSSGGSPGVWDRAPGPQRRHPQLPDYSGFGEWGERLSPSSVRDPVHHLDADEVRPDSLADGSLLRTAHTGSLDPGFPAHRAATHGGESTLARGTTTLYGVDVEIGASLHAPRQQGDEGARLATTFSTLTSHRGESDLIVSAARADGASMDPPFSDTNMDGPIGPRVAGPRGAARLGAGAGVSGVFGTELAP